MFILLTALLSFSVFKEDFYAIRKAEMKTVVDSQVVIIPMNKNIPPGYTILSTIPIVHVVSLKDSFVFELPYFERVSVSDLIGGILAREGDKNWKPFYDAIGMTIRDSKGKQMYPIVQKGQKQIKPEVKKTPK